MRNNLGKLRRRRGWSQGQTAELMGLSLGGYAKLEYSQRELRMEHIQRAAEIFGVSILEVTAGLPTAPLMGAVNAGLPAFDYGSAYEGLDRRNRVHVAPGHFAACPAAYVAGTTMEPCFPEGALVFFGAGKQPPSENLVGHAIVGETVDGILVLRKLQRGSKRHFWDLEAPNGTAERDVVLIWAAAVDAVVFPHVAKGLIEQDEEDEQDQATAAK